MRDVLRWSEMKMPTEPFESSKEMLRSGARRTTEDNGLQSLMDVTETICMYVSLSLIYYSDESGIVRVKQKQETAS